MLVHGAETQTAAQYNLDIIYMVINTSYYSASYSNDRNNLKQLTSLPTHYWTKFAKSLGGDSCIVYHFDKIRSSIKKASKSMITFL